MPAIRDAGARVRLITDGDVSASLLAVSDRSPVSLLWGIGGTPEGVVWAAAISRPSAARSSAKWPRDDGERQAVEQATTSNACSTRTSWCAARSSRPPADRRAILQGVRYEGGAATTESIVMRARTDRCASTRTTAEAARLHRRARTA